MEAVGMEHDGSQIPRAWIGQDVILCRTGTEDWKLVPLEGVGEFGLAYTYKTGAV